jgi:hypothetical protein
MYTVTYGWRKSTLTVPLPELTPPDAGSDVGSPVLAVETPLVAGKDVGLPVLAVETSLVAGRLVGFPVFAVDTLSVVPPSGVA